MMLGVGGVGFIRPTLRLGVERRGVKVMCWCGSGGVVYVSCGVILYVV